MCAAACALLAENGPVASIWAACPSGLHRARPGDGAGIGGAEGADIAGARAALALLEDAGHRIDPIETVTLDRRLCETAGIETAALLADCARLVDGESRFLILTTYAVRLSAIALSGLMAPLVAHLPGRVRAGEMTLREESRGILLPTAIFACWERG